MVSLEKTLELTQKQISKTPGENACEFLSELFLRMGMNSLTTKIISEDSKYCEIKIDGEEVKYILGWHGEILDSLQYLTCLVNDSKDQNGQFCKIRLEASNYRENRKNTLSALAKNKAFQALKLNKCIRLEPMKSYERKIIHTSIGEIKGVYSWSEGKDKFRYVVIAPTYD